jgi:peptidoglycan/xylan/chitin deacetylase (PgdA/CDA1 family)
MKLTKGLVGHFGRSKEQMAMERQTAHEKPLVGTTGKRVIKRGLQLLVSTLGRPVWCFPNHSLVILTYHRILADRHPELATMQPGMVVSASTFDMHLSVLRKYFTLVHLSDWIRRSRAGNPLPPRACAITFDDGWIDNYEFALPLLRKHQAPGTLFLVSDFVGTKRRFWPERLEAVLRGARDARRWGSSEFRWLKTLGVAPHNTPDEIISRAKALQDRELETLIQAMEGAVGLEVTKSCPSLMDWRQAREFADSGLVEIGSHTRSHYRMGRVVSEAEAYDEIVGSKNALEERLGRPIDLFCYPNGEISSTALRVVRRHYLAACSTKRGWNSIEHDVHRLHRIGIHEGISSDYHAFLSRLSGWL